MEAFFAQLVGIVWYYPVVLLCLLSGIFFTFRLSFVQIKSLPHALALLRGKYDDPNEEGQITHFQALSAALSATIGLGNIAGVAIAIAVGGPGSIFWMWIVGIFGMATKFIECTLGTKYRDIDEKTGEVHGGPMYYIEKGLGKSFKPLAIVFAVLTMLGGFGGANMFQSNQAASALYEFFHIEKHITGIVLFALATLVLMGGIKRIGKVASKLVPFMCAIYISGALFITLINIHLFPNVISTILIDAFTGTAAAGGAIGVVIITGVRRAIFSNEAGIGSAPIAHAAVKTDYPIREGIVASLGPLIDTIIVCTATASVIILSGFYGTEKYQPLSPQTISFENRIDGLSSGWTTTQETPENTEPLRLYKDSDTALHYQTANQNHAYNSPSIFIRNNGRLADGIRLSAYIESGNMLAQVKNQKGVIIDTFKLNQKQSDNSQVTIENGLIENEWGSIVILFSDELKKTLVDEKLSILFTPVGKNNSVYIDRIQAIKTYTGVALTQAAFDKFLPKFGSIFITIAVIFFAFSTLITWSYYGTTASYYLFGEKGKKIYMGLFLSMILYGAIETVDVVINFSDAMLGLMVIPNSIAMVLLSKKVMGWSKDYFSKLKSGEITPYKGEST
jgi:alanine or glycine:cation symporter, AGCS family